MPLRDHFRPPDMRLASWEEVHGFWAGMITLRLNDILPSESRSGVNLQRGTPVGTEELTPPEYEVRIYDESMGRRWSRPSRL